MSNVRCLTGGRRKYVVNGEAKKLLYILLLTLLPTNYRFVEVRRNRHAPLRCAVMGRRRVPRRVSRLVRRGGGGMFRVACRIKSVECLVGKCKRRLAKKCDVRIRRISRSRGTMFYGAELVNPRGTSTNDRPSCPYVILGVESARGPVRFLNFVVGWARGKEGRIKVGGEGCSSTTSRGRDNDTNSF